MLFDTPIFFVFLILVVAAYWKLPHRGQNIFLLIASYFFYGWWDWRFLFLMAGSTITDFWIARGIEHSVSPKTRKHLLVLSLVLNFGFLGFFKYLNFFVDSFARVATLLGAHDIPTAIIRIILPPAISFYTFQEVAYIVDVYKGRINSADSLIEYALFISLFPHLIAGPIQRPSHLLPQVQTRRYFDAQHFFHGCMLIISGLFRKCVIADNCAVLATSLQDFWRRWHISLSSWLRDYLYIPLGGNRLGENRTYINLLLTMLLGGLWHGANWTFVFWGALHGGALAVERWFRSDRRAVQGFLGTWARRIIVFHFVCFTWIFFRAPSFRAALNMLKELGHAGSISDFLGAAVFLGFFVALALALDLTVENNNVEYPSENWSPYRQMATAVGGLAVIAFLGLGKLNAFIYFQF